MSFHCSGLSPGKLHNNYNSAKNDFISCPSWLDPASTSYARVWGLPGFACSEMMAVLGLHTSLTPFGNLSVRTERLCLVARLFYPLPRLTAAAVCPFRAGRRLHVAQQNWAAWSCLTSLGLHLCPQTMSHSLCWWITFLHSDHICKLTLPTAVAAFRKKRSENKAANIW